MNRYSCRIPPDQDIHPCDYEEVTDVPGGRCILWVLCYRARTRIVRSKVADDTGSRCALPNNVGASSRPLRPRMWADRHPRQRLLPCCACWRDRRTLDDPRGRRPVPASAWRLRRLRPPSMVIVLRRLEVGATVKGREALPHGRSVADCPLLPPSRRLAQPGRHDGIGRGARAHSLYSFKRAALRFR